MGGYVVDIDRDVLEGASSFSDEAGVDRQGWDRDVYAHDGVHPFWDIAR